MPFYHGTSSLSCLEDKLLPPSQHSFGINEIDRKKHDNKVFFTTHKDYALRYARGCVSRVGGTPVVYEVLSSKPKLMTSVKGCDVWFDNEAIILDKVL